MTGQYLINSLDTLNDVLKVLKINKKDQTGTYYVSFRTNTVPFGMGSTYASKVNIHRTNPGSTQTFFITALDKSQTFTDAKNGISITAIDTKLLNSASIKVTISP